MEKLSLNNSVKNEEILQRVIEERASYIWKQKKAKWIGHILRGNRDWRNYNGRGRKGIKHDKLQDMLKELRSYWDLK